MKSSSLASLAKHWDFVAIDLLSMAIAFVVSYWLKFGNLSFINQSAWRGLFVVMLLTNIVLTLVMAPYSGIFRRSYWEDFGANLKMALVSFLVLGVAFYLLKIGEDYSREMLVVTYAFYILFGLLFKAIWKKVLLTRGDRLPIDSVRKMIVVTTRDEAAAISELVTVGDLRFADVVGFCLVDDDSRSEGEYLGKPWVAPAKLPEIVFETKADEVVVTVSADNIPQSIYESLMEDGTLIRLCIAESLGFESENKTLGKAGALKTLDMERYTFGTGQLLYLPIKRVCDIVFGAIGSLLALVVAACVKIAYLISGDVHPVLYCQERIGLRGKPFTLYKFRSMVWDADGQLERLLQDPAIRQQWEQEQKLDDDPRVTPIGRFLRRTSLDEFPQFWNVVKGDMSIVGPRPLLPGELEEHGGRSLYNKVKPGITGWWGCNGRSNIEYRERLELEYHYVRHCSLYLDLLCVLRTFVAVLKKDGAQ